MGAEFLPSRRRLMGHRAHLFLIPANLVFLILCNYVLRR